jgi:hypothetical protein
MYYYDYDYDPGDDTQQKCHVITITGHVDDTRRECHITAITMTGHSDNTTRTTTGGGDNINRYYSIIYDISILM